MLEFDALKEYAQSSWKAQAKWREESEEDFAFEAGHQWTDAEKSALQEQSRVPIVFNRTAVIISSVTGSEINNRTEVRFIPREIGDAKPNEVLTAGAEWFRDIADAEDEESAAFHDLLICGVGVTETGLDWEADPEGEPDVERVDPLEFFWDCYAHRKGLSDARYLGRVRQMAKAEALEMFEGKDAREIDAAWIKSAGDADEHRNIAGDEYTDGEMDEDGEEKDTLTVVQVQYRVKVKAVEYIDPATGERGEMEQAKWDKMAKFSPMLPQHRKITKWVWHQAFLGASGILMRNQPDPDGPTLHAMTGHWDTKEKRFYGILRSMKDPQKFANKWLSQTLHIINSNAKGGVMLEADAVADTNQFEESWAAADGVTWMKAGAIANGKIKEKPKADMPVALMSLTEFAISAIRDASGVNLELLGLRDANQPGVLEYQRRQSAMTTLARFFDSLRYYRKRQGRTILGFLRNYIAPSGRLVRIVKGENVQYVPLAMAGDTAKYDVIVDDAPQAPNEKEKAWSVIEAMMPLLQQAQLSMEDWADILEYSPLPASFADKVREKALEQKKQGPDPMQQLAVQKEQSEIEENRANALLDQVKAAQIQTETQLAPMELALEEQGQQMTFAQAMAGPQNTSQ